MDESRLWRFVFVISVLIGSISILILLPLPNGFDYVLRDGTRLLSIFLGMLAGTSLGEIIKIRNNNKTGETLLSDLIEELRANLDLLGERVPLRKGFWILGVRSGRAQYLQQNDRRSLWEIYSRITHYNEDLLAMHRASLVDGRDFGESRFDTEMDKLCEEIEMRIGNFLESHKEYIQHANHAKSND